MGSAAEQLAVRVKAAADAADELAACVKPAAAAAEQLAARVKAAEVAADQHLMPLRSLAERTPNERDDELLAVAAATPAVPPVAPRSMPSHRRASGRLPVVPVAALQAPSPGRSDPTPSPVPRVSLVPPTGRHDHPRPALHGASEARNQPTVAARRHGDVGPAPAHTVPPSGRAPRRGFLDRLAKDLRSSKREVVLGLGIGLGLSFMLVRWGQEYLTERAVTERAMPDPGPEFSIESLTVNPGRLPAAPAPAAAVPPVRRSALPSPGGPSPGVPSPGASGKDGPVKETAPVTQAPLVGAQQVGPRRASASNANKAKSGPAARPRSGTDPNLDARDAVLQAPGDELEPRDLDPSNLDPSKKAPLSPSQSAGLGLDLPL